MPEKKRSYSTELCRVCLTRGHSMISLKSLLEPESKLKTMEVLEKVMHVQLIRAPHLPKHICGMCQSLLKISYDFKVQFEKTQSTLHEQDKEQGLSECYETYHKHSRSQQQENKEVELIVGSNKYNLKDVLIVEEEITDKNLFQGFLNNLGKTVSVQFTNNMKITENKSQNEIDNGFTITKLRNPKVLDNMNKDIESLIIDTKNVMEYRLIENIEEVSDRHEMIGPVVSTIQNNIELEIVDLYTASGDNTTLKSEEPQDTTILTDELFMEALNSKHICKFCNTVFATKTRLQKHLVFQHEYSNLPFITKYKYKKNKRKLPQISNRKSNTTDDENAGKVIKSETRSENPDKYLCQQCGHISQSQGGAAYHQLKHEGKNHNCHLCKKKFYTRMHLKRHLNYTHLQKISVELCPICGKYCNSGPALKYHLKVHRKEKLFECIYCDRGFFAQSALKTHLRRHTGERCYPCNDCNKEFFTSGERLKHQITHTGARPHNCTYCNKAFSTNFNLKMHLMSHNGSYVCGCCHRGFIELEVLKMHMKSKHKMNLDDVTEEQNFDM